MSYELAPEDVIALNRLTTVARVLAGTAHELNNALQIIAGSAEMLAQQTEVADPARRAIQRIQAQTTRAAETVNDVMHFARGAGQPATRVSLRSIASKAIALRMYQVRRAGLALLFEPAQAPAGVVRGKDAQLLQVVLNLIMNAEQALAGVAGGTIALEMQESDQTVVLTVADNGPGLAGPVIERLFTPFATTHPTPDAQGLGLAAARLIARAHGGDVVIGMEGGGCRASLSLPLYRH